MVVVEFEPLDETGVEHRGRRGAGRSAAPSDEQSVPGIVEFGDAFHSLAGDGQLRTDEGAGDAVEQQVLCALAHGRGDVVKRGFGEPGGKPSCGPIRVGGGLGAFARYFGLNGLASDSHEEPFIKYISIKGGYVFRRRTSRCGREPRRSLFVSL